MDERNDLFNVRGTVLEMLEDRGVEFDKSYKISKSEFMTAYEADNIDIYIDGIYVFMQKGLKKFGKSELLKVLRAIEEAHGEDTHIILCLKDKLSDTVRTELRDGVEVFLQRNLIFNPTKHILVPKYRLLSEEETKVILKKLKTVRATLPKQTSEDPISKYYGANPGQVFEIIRRSPASGVSTAYRVVR